MADDEDLVEAMLAAPVGVALLGSIERRAAGARHLPELTEGTRPISVDLGAELVDELPWPALLELVLEAADIAGPWHSTAVRSLVAAYTDAPARRPIAEAVAERFGGRLDAPLDPSAQEWWTDEAMPSDHRFFERFDRVYGRGAFTFGGLWTVTAPPSAIHDELISGSWDFVGPPERWSLPADPTADVVEVHRPSDWAALVERFPSVAAGRHVGWELPGLNQSEVGLAALLRVPGQHAAHHRDTYLAPDWAAVAAAHDAVHLSWAGFLTSEGYVSPLSGGGVAMLRYWGSERTLWLRDRFGEPTPLPPAAMGEHEPAPDLQADAARAERSRSALLRSMGRGPGVSP
jgi:hypothetical protein